jgi:hypothetical protein
MGRKLKKNKKENEGESEICWRYMGGGEGMRGVFIFISRASKIHPSY